MTDTEKLIEALDARYAAGQIGFQEGVSALANHDALKTAKRLALALSAIEAAKEYFSMTELLATGLSSIARRSALKYAGECKDRFKELVTNLEQPK